MLLQWSFLYSGWCIFLLRCASFEIIFIISANVFFPIGFLSKYFLSFDGYWKKALLLSLSRAIYFLNDSTGHKMFPGCAEMIWWSLCRASCADEF